MPLPQGNNLRTLGYGDGAYLAGGEGDRVVLSTNAVDWTAHEVSVLRTYAPAGAFVSRLARGNKRWLGVIGTVTGSLLATSDAGETWTNAHAALSLSQVFSLAGGPGGFVAVTGPGPSVVTSADGCNWQAARFYPPLGGESVFAAAYANARFLLVGTSNLWWSLDGQNFARGSSHAFSSAVSILWGSGQYVALDQAYVPDSWPPETRLYSSADGTEWVLRYAGRGDNAANGLAYGNGRFIVTGGFTLLDGNGGLLGSQVLISSNGVQWVTNATPVLDFEFGPPVGNDAGFVRAGRSGNIISSADGIAWQPRVQATRNNFRAIAHEDGLYVAVGNDGKLVTSSDGVQWTVHPSGTSHDLRAVAAGNGRWVAVGEPGALVTSTNGLQWSAEATAEADLYGVAFSDGLFVAVGEGATVWRSANGADWRQVRAGQDGLRLHGITHGPAGWLATGRSVEAAVPTPVTTAFVLTSSDAVDWTPSTLPVAAYLENVAFADGLYVAVGAPPTILVSSNGLTWSDTTPPSLGEAGLSPDLGLGWVAAGNGTFVVVGDDGMIYSSRDGSHWTRRYSGFASRNLRGVVYANGLFTAVGNNDAILQSGNVLPRLNGALRPGGFEITLRGETNRAYAIEASTDLGVWQGVHALTNIGFASTWLDALVTTSPRRFYRAIAR